MSASTISAGRRSNGVSLSPFLDFVDVAEVTGSVRRMGGRTRQAAAALQSEYRGTAVAQGPWRLTVRGRRLVRVFTLVAATLAAVGVTLAGVAVARAGLLGVDSVSATSSTSARGTFSDAATLSRVGNEHGIGGDQQLTPTSQVQDVTADWVTVQPGDTLWAIATRADPTGDPREMLVRIREVNGPEVSQLVVGQRIRLPGRN